MRNKDGCVILDNYKELPQAYKIGRKEKIWLSNGEHKFLFKYGASNYEIWAELIAEELGKQCHIEMAEYDLATYKGKRGVVTKDFRQPGELAVTIEKFIEHLQHALMANDVAKDIRGNSVQNIITAIFLDDNENLTEEIIYELISRWSFYGLIMESDKNATNLSIIKSKNSIWLSKDYDNSTMCRMNENINTFINNIRGIQDIYKMTDDIYQALTLENDDSPRFLDNFDKLCQKYARYSDHVMQRFSGFDIDAAIENVEKKINEGNVGSKIEVPWEVKFWLGKVLNLRYKDMCGIYNNNLKKRQEEKMQEEQQIKGKL